MLTDTQKVGTRKTFSPLQVSLKVNLDIYDHFLNELEELVIIGVWLSLLNMGSYRAETTYIFFTMLPLVFAPKPCLNVLVE